LGRSLFIEASTLGFMGGAGAAILGSGIALFMLRGMEAGFSWKIPYQVPWGLAAIILAVGIAIAAAAASYPRRLAVRIPIIEALRYE
jgi:ABC-type antimicrobial peptide transport system permease subunit